MNEITLRELEGESMELLPERETLFFNTYWTKTNFAYVAASNSSLALNAASLMATATANAVQTIAVGQS
jgi:hypothetical protein